MRAILVALIACLLLDGCALTHRMHRHAAPGVTKEISPLPQQASHEVAEAFAGEAQPGRDLDSIASWLAPGGATWVIATAAQSDRLLVFDGDSGKLLRTVGASGAGAGQFHHPDGITAYADLLFVVERDNHRVQVLHLPDFKPLGSFGSEQLRSPLGIWLHETAPDEYEVLVTDNDTGGKSAPPATHSGQMVKRFRVRADAGVLHADYAGAFGDGMPAGALRSVESIVGDDDNGRLAIAEQRNVGSRVRVYGMGGRDSGKQIGAQQYRARAGALALFSCADGSGYWVGVDRDPKHSAFLLFDRKSLAYLGAFTGKGVADIGGIVLQPASTPHFPDGVLYTVRDDAVIVAFDWGAIERALQLRPDCTP